MHNNLSTQASPRYKLLFYVIMMFFCLVYCAMSIANHYFFRTTAFDYGPYNYAFWDYAHFRITPCPIYSVFWGNTKVTFLQDHFSLTLMFLVPFYWLFNWLTGTYTIMFIQIAFIMWGAWAIYKLISLKSGDGWLGCGAVVYYFLLQGRYAAFEEDCNIIIMCSCFVPVFIWYFESKRFVAATIVFVLAIFSREDMSLWFVFIPIVLLIWHIKEKKIVYACLWYILASVVCFILMFKVFIPLIESPDKPYTLFEFKALGSNPFQAFIFIIKHPVDTFFMLFKNHLGNEQYNGIKEQFYFVYLISGGFVLFFRPQYFIWFIPLIAQKMLNDEPLRWSIESYYTVQVAILLPIPVFLIISMVKSKIWKYSFVLLLCCLALYVTCYEANPKQHKLGWDTGIKRNILAENFFKSTYNIKGINRDIDLIPADAHVCASASILPHLAQRKFIYEFPDVKDAEYIAVFSFPDFYLIPSDKYTKELFEKYVFNPNWKILACNYPLILLKKDSTSKKVMQYDSIICNIEIVSKESKHLIASDNQLLDSDIETIDKERAYSGKSSVKLTKERPFGLTWHPKNVKPNDILRISVWRYSENKNNGTLAISNGKDLYLTCKDGISKNSNGWEQLVLYCVVPIDYEKFNIYLWNNEGHPVWFDNMEIKKYNNLIPSQ